MKLQQVLSLTRKAVDDYQMIEAGDHIAVGISGGKDSLTLLDALQGLRRFYPAAGGQRPPLQRQSSSSSSRSAVSW